MTPPEDKAYITHSGLSGLFRLSGLPILPRGRKSRYRFLSALPKAPPQRERSECRKPGHDPDILRIDYAAGCAYLNGEELHLTPIEYKLLSLLARNCGKVLTHNYITQQVWGTSWENNVASLRVFMATLRKKTEPASDSPSLIQTHVGIGYRMIRIDS